MLPCVGAHEHVVATGGERLTGIHTEGDIGDVKPTDVVMHGGGGHDWRILFLLLYRRVHQCGVGLRRLSGGVAREAKCTSVRPAVLGYRFDGLGPTDTRTNRTHPEGSLANEQGWGVHVNLARVLWRNADMHKCRSADRRPAGLLVR